MVFFNSTKNTAKNQETYFREIIFVVSGWLGAGIQGAQSRDEKRAIQVSAGLVRFQIVPEGTIAFHTWSGLRFEHAD